VFILSLSFSSFRAYYDKIMWSSASSVAKISKKKTKVLQEENVVGGSLEIYGAASADCNSLFFLY